MGNYIFTTEALIEAVRADAEASASKHDMGGNIVPMLVEDGSAHVYDFSRNTVPGETERDRGYWRDVGTLDAFYDAHMDLISVHPVFNLYNREWPILTWPDPLPPAKFVFEEEGRDRARAGLDGLRGRGHLGRDRAALGALAGRARCTPTPRSRTRSCSRASTSPARRSCAGRSSTRTCACSRARRSASTPRRDRARGFTVSDGGVIVVGKGEVVEP